MLFEPFPQRMRGFADVFFRRMRLARAVGAAKLLRDRLDAAGAEILVGGLVGEPIVESGERPRLDVDLGVGTRAAGGKTLAARERNVRGFGGAADPGDAVVAVREVERRGQIVQLACTLPAGARDVHDVAGVLRPIRRLDLRTSGGAKGVDGPRDLIERRVRAALRADHVGRPDAGRGVIASWGCRRRTTPDCSGSARRATGYRTRAFVAD